MRIVAGTHRGRTLKTPSDSAIRPTGDKVRQAVFNILNHRGAVVDAIVLDAFCGTGALGLEALSQGAQRVVFFDTAKSSLTLAGDNARLLKEESSCLFLNQDATRSGSRPASIPQATLVFLDPPYRKGLVEAALIALKEGDWLAPGCIVVAEAEKEADMYALPGEILSEKTYGETKIAVLAV